MESNLQDLLSQQMLEIDTEFDKFCSQITDNQLCEIIIDSTYQGDTSSRFELHPNSRYASPKSDEHVTLLQKQGIPKNTAKLTSWCVSMGGLETS